MLLFATCVSAALGALCTGEESGAGVSSAQKTHDPGAWSSERSRKCLVGIVDSLDVFCGGFSLLDP